MSASPLTHADATAHAPAHGRLFWAGVVVGGAVVVIGLWGLIDETRPVRRVNVALFLAGAGVAHDFLWAPLVVAVAAATRRVPAAARAWVRAGLAATAFVLLFAAPVLRGEGRFADHPSALPLPYARNAAAVLGAIWVTVGAGLFLRARRDRAQL